MWPSFAQHEEYYDFTVLRTTEEDSHCYTLTFASPIPVPGIIKFKNGYHLSVEVFFTHVEGSERVRGSDKINLMPSPHLAAGAADVFTIYREALLPVYSKQSQSGDPSPKIIALHLICKNTMPTWANTSLSEFAVFQRNTENIAHLAHPQAPQVLFQDRCERPGTATAKNIYTLLNAIAGAQYYLNQVQEISKNTQVSASKKFSTEDCICTDISKY